MHKGKERRRHILNEFAFSTSTMVANFFLRLNSLEVTTNENLNIFINSILALITVLAVHDFIEGLIIRDNKVLSPESVEALLMMRSHGSFRKILAIILGHRWEDGLYHSPKCQCHLCKNANHTTRTNAASSMHEPVKKRLLLKTFLGRILTIIVELVVIGLALTRTTETYITRGAWAITPLYNRNQWRAHPLKLHLGCETVFSDPEHLRTELINRFSQIRVCTRQQHRFEEQRNLRAPAGFQEYFFDTDLSSDEVRITRESQNVSLITKMYALWNVDCSEGKEGNTCKTPEIHEGMIATIIGGREYSTNRSGKDTVLLSNSTKERVRRKFDRYLHTVFPHAYRTVYPTNATSWTDEAAKRPPRADYIFRMHMYFNVTELELLHEDENIRSALLLHKIVGLQYRPGERSIWYSTGNSMKHVKDPVLEYRVQQPVLGSVLWIILLVLAFVIRAVLAAWFPNNIYELIADFVRRA